MPVEMDNSRLVVMASRKPRGRLLDKIGEVSRPDFPVVNNPVNYVAATYKPLQPFQFDLQARRPGR